MAVARGSGLWPQSCEAAAGASDVVPVSGVQGSGVAAGQIQLNR